MTGKRILGITYDTGCETAPGRYSRIAFDSDQVVTEMEVIARDLHCTAVRLVGNDLERLKIAAGHAVRAGLDVWFSPVAHNQPETHLLDLLGSTACLARDHANSGTNVVLMVGWESSVFVPGMIRGATTFDRLRTLGNIPRLLLSTALYGSFNRRLDQHLAKAVAVARGAFDGPITYAAGMWESVNWSRFDLVAVDAYRDAANADRFETLMHAYTRHGKPVAAAEFGCCTYRGAGERGGLGWSVADPATGNVAPGTIRDEEEQATYVEDVLRQLWDAGVTATFPFTFASYSYPTPATGDDLDVGAYGLVRCYTNPPSNVSYPGMPWEPKVAFHRLARLYSNSA